MNIISLVLVGAVISREVVGSLSHVLFGDRLFADLFHNLVLECLLLTHDRGVEAPKWYGKSTTLCWWDHVLFSVMQCVERRVM